MEEINCKYGIPRELVSDNGTQFPYLKLQELCLHFEIHQLFTSVEHPQTNGLAEVANKVILTSLKKKLNKVKEHWVEVLLEILWGYHSMVQLSTQEKPNKLVFRAETMMVIEVFEMSLRRTSFNKEENNDGKYRGFTL